MDENEYDDLPLRERRAPRRAERADRRAAKLRAPVPEREQESLASGPSSALPGEATVVAITRGQCEVEYGENVRICYLPKALAEVQKSELAVGDRIRLAERPNGELVLAQILPRANRLSRPDPLLAHRERVLAANIDLAVVVTAFRHPPLSTGLVDRFLVALAHGGVPATIAVNKCDLVEGLDLRDWQRSNDREVAELAPYRDLTLPLVLCSARSSQGIEQLRSQVSGRTVVFVGHSGVGKSSLLGAIAPDLDLRVGEVSAMNSRGRHTTTRARIYRLSDSTRVIDTPGIREFGLWKLTRSELALYFEEFEAFSLGCRFHDCSHSHEPHCAVRAAAESGELPPGRYATYLRMLESLATDR